MFQGQMEASQVMLDWTLDPSFPALSFFKNREMIKKVIELYKNNQLDEAFEMLMNLRKENPKNEDLYLWIGKIHYKKQEWGLAINAFTKVLELNPNNREAKTSTELANAILSYYTPDMFNP